MAYNTNGKVYTDHSLMDEIVYNSKIIVEGIILKNSKVADNLESIDSITQSDYYIAIINGTMNFKGFPFNLDMLKAYGYSTLRAKAILLDRSKVPDNDKDSLFEFCSKYFIENYIEFNDYYRMLNGEPSYESGEDFFVYLDPNNPKLLSEEDIYIDFDYSKPLHLFDTEQLNFLESIGIMDDIYEDCPEPEYRYLHYLGSKKISYYKARTASLWEILYIPSVEPLVQNRFIELYNINREIYYRKTYQDAYKLDSDYYDEMMMLCVVCQTFTDIIAEIPEWYIRRDIFDLRTCQYFLESQGIKFFKQIPLKYQVRMVKNMNKLIKYKSTNKNIFDILELFAVSGTTVYRYYLLKKFKYCIYEYTEEGIFLPDGTLADINEDFDFGDENLIEGIIDMTDATIYNFIDEEKEKIKPTEKLYYYDFGDENDADIESDAEFDYKEEKIESYKIIPDEEGNVYELEFVKTPIGENYDDYIKDNMNRYNYDTLTLNDPYWDGEDVHSYIRNKHLMKDFTIEGTKYMSLEYKVSMQEYMTQMAYFLTLLFQTRLDTSSIKFSIPSIKPKMEFSIRNLFILIYCLNGLYNDKKPNIRLPGNLKTKPKPEYENYPNDVDGGHPWSGINPITGEEILPPYPMPEPEPDWTVPDIDFGCDDTENIKNDKYAELYDFGYHITINKYSKPFYDYDYCNEDDGYEEKPPEKDPNDKEYWDDFERGYYDRSINGYYPEDQRYMQDYNGGRGEYSVVTHETFYDWLRWKYPYMWVDISGRILGFNLNVDLEELEKNISIRHSKFQFEHGFTLKDLGCDTYRTAESVNTIEELIDLYQNNLKCYRTLKQLLIDTTDKDEKRVYQYVYDTLFTSDYPYDIYRLPNGEYAKTYIDLLKILDPALYKFYRTIEKENDKEARKEMVRGILNDIVSVLEYYISGDNLQYVLSFIGTNSLQAVIEYISLVINFFKSWKVYFLDPVVTYILDDKTENTLNHNDGISEIKYKFWYNDNNRHRDLATETDNYYLAELRTERQKEFLESIPHYEPEKPFKIYDGGRVSEDFYDETIDSDYNSVTEDLPIVDGAYDLNGGLPYCEDPKYNVILPPNPENVPDPVPFDPDWRVPNLDFGDEETEDIVIDRFTVYYDFGDTIDVKETVDDVYVYDYNIEYDDEDEPGEFFEPIEPNLDYSKYSTTNPIPYFQVNGGLVAARQDVYNVDGAGAIDMQEYLTIDGKHCIDIDTNTFIPDRETGILQESAYDVDGGQSSVYTYFSKTMVTKITNELEISAEVKISPYRHNGICVVDDGVYVKNVFVSKDSYELIEDDSEESRKIVKEFLEKYGESVKIYGNYDTMCATVDDIFNDYFEDAESFLVDMRNHTTENDISDRAEQMSQQIRQWFIGLNLFAWEEMI